MMIAANYVNAQECGPKSVYFMAGYEGGAGDQAVIDRLEAMGWTVFDTIPVKDEGGNLINYVDAAGYDIVLLSSTISSGDATQFYSLPVPVLTWESFAASPSRLGLTKANVSGEARWYDNIPYNGKALGDTTNSYEYLDIADDPRADELGLTVTYTDEILALTDRVPIAGGAHPGVSGLPNTETAIEILKYKQEDIKAIDDEGFITNQGTFIDSAHYAAFVYEEGAVMGEDTIIAPAARGFWFFHDQTAVVASEEVWDIFEAMVKWMTGCDLTVGIGKPESPVNQLKVYPSPVSHFATVVMEDASVNGYGVEVFDLTGRRFISTRSQEDRMTIDMRSLPSGIYMIRVTADDSKTYTSKVVES